MEFKWLERGLTNELFYLALPLTLYALDIINGCHTEIESFQNKFAKGWNYETRRVVSSLEKVVASFEFIFSLARVYSFLHLEACNTWSIKWWWCRYHEGL